MNERTKIFEHYRPIELDYTIDPKEKQKIMYQWAQESFSLFLKYINQYNVQESINNANLHFRNGAKELLKDLYEKNIPVIIMSAGIGNIIKCFMEKEKVLYDNITIVSNFFEFTEEGPKIELSNIMATSNKSYDRIPQEMRNSLKSKEKIFLIGDIVEDLRMVDEPLMNKTITIGVLDHNVETNLEKYNSSFDIVFTNEESFDQIKNIVQM